MARGATNTKMRILQMARNLYSAHGCEGTTLEDILTAAGITKGAFYHYFKSKESLCETIIEQVTADYRQLAMALDADAEPIDQLREMIAKLARLNASGEWVNCRLILRLSVDSHESQPQIQRKLRDFWEWETGFYEDLVQRCREAGQLSRRLSTKTQTRLITAVMAGMITLESIAPSQESFDKIVATVIDMLQ